MSAHFRVAFPRESGDLLGRLSRRRWRAEFEGPCAGVSGTLVVEDERALPVPGSGPALAAAARRRPGVVIFPLDSGARSGPAAWSPPAAMTASEVERMVPPPAAPGERALTGPLAGSPARFVPDGESRGCAVATGFRVIRVPETFGIREEILDRIPPGAKRLLDIGCGAGETAAEARRRNPGLIAEGIERDAHLAQRARGVLDAVHTGDALDALADLGRRGHRFDVIVFADSLEHLSDPFLALEAAHRIAAPGATLVVSVPNAAAAPLVADLIAGRFDPVGAGPEDAGHLRWLTRSTLGELLTETGFSVTSCEGVPVPGDSPLAGHLAAAGIEVSRAELSTIQWIATATAAPGAKHS